MQVLINFSALLLVGGFAWVVFQIAEGFRNKALAILGGFVGLVLLVSILPSAVEKPDYSVGAAPMRESSTIKREEQSKLVTLKNYKEKGDSVWLECSGATGSISCKPAK